MGKLFLLFLFSLVGCSQYSYVLEKIYFGRNIDSNTTVSDSSWEAFKRDFITPKFPQGFSVLNAEGQWRDSTGNIIQEKTFLLEIIHLNDDSASYRAARQIVDQYKSKFKQEAVLQVILPTDVNFNYSP
jgi:hypothetical protein